jgi:hypothetical protein
MKLRKMAAIRGSQKLRIIELIPSALPRIADRPTERFAYPEPNGVDLNGLLPWRVGVLVVVVVVVVVCCLLVVGCWLLLLILLYSLICDRLDQI